MSRIEFLVSVSLRLMVSFGGTSDFLAQLSERQWPGKRKRLRIC
jgi:hypothetical protein